MVVGPRPASAARCWAQGYPLLCSNHGAHLGRTGGVAHEIPTAVDEYQVRDHAECVERPLGAEALGFGHSEFVTLGRADVTHPPRQGPGGDGIKERFAFSGGEHLRVTDPGDAPPLRHGESGNGQRPGPRSPTDLIDADDHAETG